MNKSYPLGGGRSTSRGLRIALGAVIGAIAVGCANDVVLGEHVAAIGAPKDPTENQTSEAVESNTSHDSTSRHFPPHDGGRPLDNADQNGGDRSDVNPDDDDNDDRSNGNPDDDGREDFPPDWLPDASDSALLPDGGWRPPPVQPRPGELNPRPPPSFDRGSEGIPPGTGTSAP